MDKVVSLTHTITNWCQSTDISLAISFSFFFAFKVLSHKLLCVCNLHFFPFFFFYGKNNTNSLHKSHKKVKNPTSTYGSQRCEESWTPTPQKRGRFSSAIKASDQLIIPRTKPEKTNKPTGCCQARAAGQLYSNCSGFMSVGRKWKLL